MLVLGQRAAFLPPPAFCKRGSSFSHHCCLCPSCWPLVGAGYSTPWRCSPSAVPQPFAAACLVWVPSVQQLLAHSWHHSSFIPFPSVVPRAPGAAARARPGHALAPAALRQGAEQLPTSGAWEAPLVGDLLGRLVVSPLACVLLPALSLWAHRVTQSLASVYCLSSLFSSALNCGVPAHTIEFVLNFQLFGFFKSINQAFLTKRPVRVFGIVAKYCNCESPWLFFVCFSAWL